MSLDRLPPRSAVLRDHAWRSILPTPTVPTRLTWAGFVDRERTIVERGAIEGRDGGFGLIGIRHFHEPETT
jgi:hypothetical protein